MLLAAVVLAALSAASIGRVFVAINVVAVDTGMDAAALVAGSGLTSPVKSILGRSC